MFCFQQVRDGSLLTPHQGLTLSVSQIFFFFASCLLFYRSAMFIHKLAHQAGNQLVGFRIFWNLLCGIPFLIPSFVYYIHIDHHRRKHFGTRHDGEYLPLADQAPWHMVSYMALSILVPLVAVVHFVLLSPIAWCSPRARHWIHQHMSSIYVLDGDGSKLHSPSRVPAHATNLPMPGGWLLFLVLFDCLPATCFLGSLPNSLSNSWVRNRCCNHPSQFNTHTRITPLVQRW